MAEEFGYSEYVVEILNELRELKRELALLRQQVSELAKKVESRREVQVSDVDAVAAQIKEGVERLNAVAQSVAENAALIRALLSEDKLKRDEACMALLEKLMALYQK
ncbi:MAG: hypothetical protein ABWK05_05815 [Pyrobaculum sp.]